MSTTKVCVARLEELHIDECSFIVKSFMNIVGAQSLPPLRTINALYRSCWNQMFPKMETILKEILTTLIRVFVDREVTAPVYGTKY